jgi:hypothetical protein
MQPTTGDQVAPGAALLSQEQLQTLARAANALGRELEEVTSNVNNYFKQLQGLTPSALAAAINAVVQQWTDRAAEAGVAATSESPATGAVARGPPSTRSGWTELDR